MSRIARLTAELRFPDPEDAHPSGVLAVGGDLRPERLLLAYRQGIFPWPAEGYPLMWHAPPERCVLAPGLLRVNRTLHKVLKRHPFSITLDTSFAEVMKACALAYRPDQDGTWITPEMLAAYTDLHRRGYAHSVEAWREGQLVGGLYGISLGKAFFGESMFAVADDASKVAFVTLVRQLQAWAFTLVDAQVETPLLAGFGATLVPRRVFGQLLAHAVAAPDRRGPWQLDEGLRAGADK